MEIEITNMEGLHINANLDLIDQNGKYSRDVVSKITTNKFELCDIIEKNNKFIEKVKEEYAKSIGYDIKKLDQMPEKTAKAFYDGFETYLEENEGHKAFLDKKVKVNFEPITLKDLKNSDYKPSLWFLLKDKIFFREKPIPAPEKAPKD
jgi:hypothetical protein